MREPWKWGRHLIADPIGTSFGAVGNSCCCVCCVCHLVRTWDDDDRAGRNFKTHLACGHFKTSGNRFPFICYHSCHDDNMPASRALSRFVSDVRIACWGPTVYANMQNACVARGRAGFRGVSVGINFQVFVFLMAKIIIKELDFFFFPSKGVGFMNLPPEY